MISPNLDSAILLQLQKYTDAFHRAESALKIVENTIVFLPCGFDSNDGGPFTPSVNELRYAGKHIVDFLEKGNTDSVNRGIAHCLRAEFDAYDCAIQFLLTECRDFQRDYRRIRITKVIPAYAHIIKDIQSISRNPATRDMAEEHVLAQKRDDFNRLSDHCAVLAASRDELNKIKRNGIWYQFFFWCGVIATMTTFVASVITIIAFFR